jgi:hypothetical protein
LADKQSSKNNRDIQQVDSVAEKLKMTERERDAFGDFLGEEKYHGEGGTANSKHDFSWKQLLENGRRFLAEVRKPKTRNVR